MTTRLITRRPHLHRVIAATLSALLLCGTLAPAAFGVAAVTGKSAAKKPTCASGKTLVRKKKRVRVTKRVRVHGKMKRKRVWVKKLVWVCVPATGLATGKDAQAPTAPGGLQAAPGNAQVALVWNPATDNVGVTGYRVYRDGQLVASPTGALHTDAGLTNGHAYTYAVAAVDAAGNVSPSATVAATPKSSRDVTAPGAPPAFTATPGDQQVALSWGAASDDVGVVYYELRRDGAAIAFQEGRTFTDTSLVNGTTYAYTVLAIDAAGNTSPASSATATPADTVAPSVPGGLAATPGNAPGLADAGPPRPTTSRVTGYRVYRDDVLIASPSTPYYSDTGGDELRHLRVQGRRGGRLRERLGRDRSRDGDAGGSRRRRLAGADASRRTSPGPRAPARRRSRGRRRPTTSA